MYKENITKTQYLAFIIISLLAFLSAIAAVQMPLLKNLENKTHDLFFIIRNEINPQAMPQDIIIVAIDEVSFQELKKPWPWPRQLHAELVDNLCEAGAKVVGFDIVFVDPTDPINDNAFSKSIQKAGNVLLASSLDIMEDEFVLKKSFVEPLDKIRSASLGIGLANLSPDWDNFIRRIPLETEEAGIFALSVVKAYLAKEDPRCMDDKYLYNKLNIRNMSEPLVINYIGPPGSIRTVSYYQALGYKDYLPKDIFKNKIVLIGLYLETTPYAITKGMDSFATPFFSVSSSRMFGVEVNANIINTLIRDIRIKELGAMYTVFILIILLVLSGLLILPLKPLNASISAVLLIMVYVAISIILFTFQRVQLPILSPFLQIFFIYLATVLYDYKIAERISIYDPLTLLLNKRSLEIQLKKNIRHAIRHNQPLSLAMADIDRFKTINDTYGHQTGDYVLSRLADALKKNLKGFDIVGRYGGEEFCIIMPQTKLSDAKKVLENLKDSISSIKIEAGPISVTMSFGIAVLAEGDDGKAIIKRADEALYIAKNSGRNRVVAKEQ